MFNIDQIREDFPVLKKEIYGKKLIYFDSGATSQKPTAVINKIKEFYEQYNSNIHRGVHFLSNYATDEYEKARQTIKDYINANKIEEIIFTKGSTEAANLIANSYGNNFLKKGDEILICETEHHANIVPWQMLSERKGVVIKVIPVDDNSEIIFEEYEKLLSEKTKIVAVAQVSNAFGTIHPIKKIIEKAHKYGAVSVIDGAQGVQHLNPDVRDLDCDFYFFSGHKIYAETGIGVLYGKEKFLEKMPPYQGGGDMVKKVSFEKTTYADLPLKFEAGTTNFVAAISVSEAIKYVKNIGLTDIKEHENKLKEYLLQKMNNLKNLDLIGIAKNKIATVSFLIKGLHHFDTGMILDKQGIAIRTGTHCAQPAMKRFGIEGTARASLSFYNTFAEIDVFIEKLSEIINKFAVKR